MHIIKVQFAILFGLFLWAPCQALAQADELPVCGDAICSPGEDCADDCPTPVCGDAVCDDGEDCPDDCAAPVCGDGVCSEAEECVDECVAPEPVCGNGVLEGDEACDDGDTDAGDGCSDVCEIENGWECNADGGASICAAICGDGLIILEVEACDDENLAAEDGCDIECKIEAGYSCAGEPSVCTPDCVPSTEDCSDGQDNDCDDLVDCADEDCGGEVCADGNACLEDSVCSEGECTAGAAISCDDEDDCTVDLCDSKSGCSHSSIVGCGSPQPSNLPDDSEGPGGNDSGEVPGGGSGSTPLTPNFPNLSGASVGCALQTTSNLLVNNGLGFVGILILLGSFTMIRVTRRARNHLR